MTQFPVSASSEQSIYGALELSKNSWLLAIQVGAAGYKLMRSLVRDMELIARPALGTKTQSTKETVMRRRLKPP